MTCEGLWGDGPSGVWGWASPLTGTGSGPGHGRGAGLAWAAAQEQDIGRDAGPWGTTPGQRDLRIAPGEGRGGGRRGWTARGGVGHLGLTHTETQRRRLWTTGGRRRCMGSIRRPTTPTTTSRTAVHQLFWAPLTHKRHPPHPAQPQHTNHWAPRTRKRHQHEHWPQQPTPRTTASKEDTLPWTECEYSGQRYFCNESLAMNGAERTRYYCNTLPASHTLVS